MRITCAILVLAVVGSSVSIVRAGDTSTIRIGINSETIGAWRVQANPSLAGAIAAFGAPSRCRRVSGLPSFA
jgi:hypothetical protein